MRLTKRNRLLKFQYLADSAEHSGIWHEREDLFFSEDTYKNLIRVIENHLRFEGVDFEEVANYNDIILNNFNRISPIFQEWLMAKERLKLAGIETKVGYRLVEDCLKEAVNIGEGAL